MSADEDLDLALYDADPVVRDGARGRLAQHPAPEIVAQLVNLLDAQHRATRRRAARILSEVTPDRVQSTLRRVIADTTATDRLRASAARVLSVLAAAPEAVLAEGLRDPLPRIRRACATTAAPEAALVAALADEEPEVVRRAANALEAQDILPPVAALAQAAARPGAPDVILRLLAAAAPADPALAAAAEAGDETALDHLADGPTLQRLFATRPVVSAWGCAQLGRVEQSHVTHADARVRAAAARGLPPDDPRLDTLARDADAAVAWMARRARAGAFVPAVLEGRLGAHAFSDAPSAKPPYGLRSADDLPEVPRVHAALALCHPRFDINLGVAIRSAEAAGFRAVYVIGREEVFRSPARGTERVLDLHYVPDAAALIRRARAADYQLVAVQQTPDSVPFHHADYPPRPLFVVGAEDRGMPEPLRLGADLVVEIPQFGIIDSLNVAAAATTVMMHWRAHRDLPPSG